MPHCDGGKRALGFNPAETGHQLPHVPHMRTPCIREAAVTVVLPVPQSTIAAAPQVYRPQEDSRLLIDTMERSPVVVGRRVVDLCTGSGIIAIAAAELGAASVA